ncbi:MAG: hypothetical protein ABIP02_04555 [Arenimonas sp.]
MNIRALAWLSLLLLSACSDKSPSNQPISASTSAKISAGPYENYVGHWEAKNKINGDANSFDNMALIIDKDGRAESKHCSGRTGSAQTQNAGEILTGLVVSELGNGVLSLSKPATPYYAEKKFRMDRNPFQENGRWYLELDGIKLRKLEESESSDYATWQCPR